MSTAATLVADTEPELSREELIRQVIYEPLRSYRKRVNRPSSTPYDVRAAQVLARFACHRHGFIPKVTKGEIYRIANQVAAEITLELFKSKY